jgi:toxin-antitoxin system PIN domain toxin
MGACKSLIPTTKPEFPNLLIYAVNRQSASHKMAKAWVEGILGEVEPVGFSWLVILGFIRLTTRPGLFQKLLLPERAFDLVEGWLAQPAAKIVQPGPRHFPILRGLMTPLGTAGNLTSDAHLAALAIEHNAQLCSCDNDFARFQGLRWKNPLV